ncbi:hypothetical protein KKF91_17305, partial [Myxococcota bacterium]|nr:hypothetical protein [Myxococcota bacterium]
LSARHLEHWLRQGPPDEPQVRQALEEGRAVHEALKALKALWRAQGDSPEVAEAIRAGRRRSWSPSPRARRHLTDLFHQGVKAIRPRLLNYCTPTKTWRDTGSSVCAPKTPRRVDLLDEAPRWTMLIDESGPHFQAGLPTPGQQEGRFVGVLLDDQTAAALPPLGRFHACDERDARLDEAIQALLDHPVGVIGVTVSDVPPATAEWWQIGVLELIDWALRLLPREGAPTRLEVRVEERSHHRAGEAWRDAVVEIQRRLAKTNADQAGIEIEIKVVGKAEHPHLAYADALAYTWGSARGSAVARLKQSGLLGGSLIAGGARALSGWWDKVTRGEALSDEEFIQLAQARQQQPESLYAALWALLEDKLSADEALWGRYFELAERHLEGKNIHLPALCAQLDLLQAADPGATLPPRTRLAWEAGRIARDNHLGEIHPLSEEIVITLSAALFDEDAPLVCLSDLQRAVAATNAFQFDAAERLIRPWLNHPIAVPGLQMHGRVLSSLGQIHAFRGELVEARARFEQALAAFERLSDLRMKRGEKAQTGTYRLICLIDDAGIGEGEARAALEGYLDFPRLEEGVDHLARARAPYAKYAHHALLRYLVQRGDVALRRRYLARMDPDAVGEGHPWPLILLYRALLLREAGQPFEAPLRAGIEQTLDRGQGPTLTLIGATMMRLAVRWGLDDYEAELAEILSVLPQVLPQAAPRLTALAQPSPHLDDLALLRATLPFNFR